MKMKTQYALVNRIREQYRGEEMMILESQHPDHPSSKKTFLAIKPRKKITARGSRITISADGKTEQWHMNPWDALKKFRQKHPGWLFGYFGYDLKNYTEELGSKNRPLHSLPDLFFMEPEQLITIESGEISIVYGKHQSTGKVPSDREKNSEHHAFEPSISREEYFSKVNAIKQKIKEGDFYELNFTYPYTGLFSMPGYWLYRQMRAINPVPFGAYLKANGAEICCSSPERFLRKEGQKIISEPIKGTAERFAEDHLDADSRRKLLNEKNRAENLMIVDLVRHDFSRVCKTGTVKVAKLYDVQSFGTVHQLISTIGGEVKDGLDEVEVIKHCFPMGSMTGAPKIEVMKQIDELENYSRGIYSGAIGYFTPDGNFDFNVVIRTAIIRDGVLVYPVGGAITSDSDPYEEWEETIVKAKNLTEVFRKI